MHNQSNAVSFVDAHHHIWIPQSTNPDLGYRWLRDIGAMKPFGDPTAIQRNYEWAEFAAESQRHTLVGSVYLQVDGAIADPVAETAWVQSVFDQSPLTHAIIGLADLSKDSACQIIEQQAGFASFRGIRQILSRMDGNPSLSFAPTHYLQDPCWRDQFQLLTQHQLSFDAQLYPEQMAEAAEFFAQHPHVPVIIDHAGSPHDQTAAGLAKLREGLSLLASLSHVAIKLCGFGMFDTQRSTQRIAPVVECALQAFGSDRVMFGSNFPVDKLMGGYDDVISMVQSNIKTLSEPAQQDIWQNNAIRLYRLSI